MGDHVQIVSGPLKGIFGMAMSQFEAGRVKVSVMLLNRSVIVDADAALLRVIKRRDTVIGEQIAQVLAPIGAEAIIHLSEHPHEVRNLKPRQFEDLIARLLEDAGYEVKMTPETRDGGRDILAVLKIPFGEILTIVECKRFAERRKIGPEIIRQLLWVADRNDKASSALLATTSSFTAGARMIEHEHKWRLKLADFQDINVWLKKFGKWDKTAEGQLWRPQK